LPQKRYAVFRKRDRESSELIVIEVESASVSTEDRAISTTSGR